MAALRPASPTWLLCALAFGYGGTAIGWNGLWVVVVADLAPPHREASAVGIGLTLVNLASAPGPWLLGAVYSDCCSHEACRRPFLCSAREPLPART
jgi:MFS family permease